MKIAYGIGFIRIRIIIRLDIYFETDKNEYFRVELLKNTVKPYMAEFD